MKSFLRSLLKAAYRFLRSLSRVGLVASFKCLIATFFSGRQQINIKGYPHPLVVRGRTSDVECFYRIFCLDEYPSDLNGFDLIIDGGANVGFASRFLRHINGAAKIVAVEPDAENFEILRLNLEHSSNIETINGALWNRDVTMQVKDPNALAWGRTFVEASNPDECENPVEAVSMERLVADNPTNGRVLVKLDVEGAEKELLEDPAWLSAVDVLVVEIHSHWRTVLQGVMKRDFEAKIWGENMIFTFR